MILCDRVQNKKKMFKMIFFFDQKEVVVKNKKVYGDFVM